MGENILRYLGKIRSTRLGQQIARGILSTKIIVNSSLYKNLYNKKIESVMSTREKSLPNTLEIGITNACNANCIMCPHHKLKKIGFMDMKLYKKIIDDASSSGISGVGLSFFGETFMDKHLIERIKYAKLKGLGVSFFTNGSLMDKKKAREIIEAGLDSIVISFDSDRKKVYEKIRRNLKFETTRNNILGLIEMKRELKKKNPKINLVFVLMDENASELKEYYRTWKNRVDAINVINMRNWSGEIDNKTKRSIHFKKGLKRDPCGLLWQQFNIDWDGKVVICCNDWAHNVVLGDMNKESVSDVWFGEKLKAIREIHKKRQFDKIPFCAKCNKKTIWWQM